MDWTRLATHTWYLGGHQNPAAPFVQQGKLTPAHATNSWLSPDKVKVALGPDCDLSPHPVRAVPPDSSIPYIDMLLGPQKPARGQSKQTTKQEESNTLPAPEEVLVTLRLQVDSCGLSDVSALIQILLGGTPIRCRNHHLWIQAVQDYFDDVPLCVPCCQLLRLVCETAPQQGCKVYLAPPDGSYHVGDLEALCRGSVPFPDSAFHLHIRPPDAVVGSASGAGHVWAGQAHFYLHDGELSRLPSDETFIQMLQQNCCLSGPRFPPPAIVEALQDYVTHYYKVRRLHLIVVDLWRPWKYNTARAREITDQLWRISHGDDTHRVSPFRPDGPEPPLRCRRFAYGYALDGSECPSYLVWPQRDGQSYTLLDTSTTDTLPLNRDFFRPLGMEHFYDSFALVSQISVRREALHLFGLREDELLPDLHITRDGVLRIGLGAHQEHRVNHVARATDRTKVSADVIQLAADEVDTALCRKVMPVTLKGVKVRVTRIRMTLLLH